MYLVLEVSLAVPERVNEDPFPWLRCSFPSSLPREQALLALPSPARPLQALGQLCWRRGQGDRGHPELSPRCLLDEGCSPLPPTPGSPFGDTAAQRVPHQDGGARAGFAVPLPFW